MSNKSSFNWSRWSKTSCAVLIGACLLDPGMASSIIAAPTTTTGQKDYTPPSDTRPPRGLFIPGGRRQGCRGVLHNGLTAIAPQTQVVPTFSIQPTLTWFVGDNAPYDITLQLYEYTGDQWVALKDVDLGPSQQGYSSYLLPDTTRLTVGGLYRWDIVMLCDPARPSRNIVNVAYFEVVRPPAGLEQSADTLLAQAQEYATAGFWYEAIALLTSAQPTPAAIDYRNALLRDLAEAEVIAASFVTATAESEVKASAIREAATALSAQFLFIANQDRAHEN